MRDDRDTRKQQAQDIQQELSQRGLSRRSLINRLATLGAGFGAAYMLGLKGADAAVDPDAVVTLKSTHPALNEIIEEGRQDAAAAEPAEDGAPARMAQMNGDYKRAYSKGYKRLYGREYKRVFNKEYARAYRRAYSKLYGREYKKGFARVYKKGYARVYKKGYARAYGRVRG